MVIPKFLIYTGLLIGPVASIVAFAMQPSVYAALIPLFAILGAILGFYIIRKKIDVICAIVKTACRIIARNLISMLVIYLLFTGIAGVLGYFIWDLVESKPEQKGLFYVLHIFTFFWVGAFFSYLFQVFAASTVIGALIKGTAETHEEADFSTTGKALSNSLYAMGTVAFGGLILAAIKTVRFLINSTSRPNNDGSRNRSVLLDVLGCILLCIISILESIIDTLNQFAYAYCAMKGTGFIDSLKESQKLVTSRQNAAFATFYAVDYTIFAFGFLLSLMLVSVDYGYYHLFSDKSAQSLAMLVLSGIFTALLHFQFIYVLNAGTLALSYAEMVSSERVTRYSPELGAAMKKIRSGEY